MLDLSAHPRGRAAEGETWKKYSRPFKSGVRGQNGDRSRATGTQLTAGCTLDQRLRTPPSLRKSEASSCVPVKCLILALVTSLGLRTWLNAGDADARAASMFLQSRAFQDGRWNLSKAAAFQGETSANQQNHSSASDC